MNGKRAKQLRRLQGISIQARREAAVFARAVEKTVAARTDRRAVQRRFRRKVLAWGGLALIVAAVIGALFL